MRFKGLLVWFVLPFVWTAAVIGAAIGLATPGPVEWRGEGMLAIYTVGAAGILVLGMAVVRRRLWLLPVGRIEQAGKRMARGEWNVRVQPHGAMAMRRMAQNLNSLAAHAQKQLADLQHERAGLQTLVDTLPDPILAADGQGRITLLNAPAAKLFSLLPEQALGQKLVSVVNDEQVVELYEALLATKPASGAVPLHRQIRLLRMGQRSTYEAVVTRVVEALLVLRDVTALAGAMQMKADFVANASHELRTPIAAIKIAFDTLREVYREDPAQSDRCIAVIEDHLRRLEEMLHDLLDLSRVESSESEPHVSNLRTSEVLAGLKATMGSLARQKNVELCLGDESTAPAEFRTDGRLLNLVLKNLVDNSIKFTPSGGRVTVTIRQEVAAPPGAPGTIILRVADTGIGIAPEFIDRVFERFYQVDSARSGSAGRGTGLGLAIVKHAIHAMGGEVRLESTQGVGTTVTCEFPSPPGNLAGV